jgi:hypothetical protein
MSYAEIVKHNGEPAVMIDGKAYPPMAMTARLCKPDYIRELGKAGIRIFYIMTNTDWLRPGGDGQPSGFRKFIQDAEALLKEVPGAYIIVRIGMHPPVSWMEDHPDDLMRYNDGSFKEAILMSEVHEDRVPGMYSLCSEAWRKDGGKALTDFCDAVDGSSVADRVIGYFLAAGGTSEWYPVNPLTLRKEGKYADFSPAFRREFAAVLKEKYGDEKTLARAWNRSDASFDNPIIPEIDSRQHQWADEKILDALVHYENASRIIGKELELNPETEYNRGIFLNADTYSNVADFYYAWHRGTANTIVHFAHIIKARYKGKLVGAFYGSYGCTGYYDASTAGATLTILDSGVVDFLAAPGVYNNREPGGLVAQREMNDSFRIRNLMFVGEEDSRTHLENNFYRDSMGLYNIEDTIGTLKRDFARNLCEDTFAWWFDQHEEGGRYQHPGIYQLFEQQQKIAALAYSLDRTKKNDIALIYDQESLFYVSTLTNQVMLDYYRTSDLNRIGAPVDYYFHDDMGREDMRDYKMYVMLNLFCLSDADREVIHQKAAKNGATVVWLYAPGFINPDREKKMDSKYTEELTGFKTGVIYDTVSPRFALCGPHPALRYGNFDRHYGYIDRDVHSNVWLSPVLPPPYANPFFYIDEDGEILGRYLINNKAAYGIKLYRGFTSVYCTAEILRSELLASLAAYSGCHLYSHTDDCVYANENFTAIHAKNTGERVLYFKKPVNPYEVYEGRYYGRNTESITVKMRKGESLLFCVNYPE